MATTAHGRKFDAKLLCGQEDYLELGREGNGVMKREGGYLFLHISISEASAQSMSTSLYAWWWKKPSVKILVVSFKHANLVVLGPPLRKFKYPEQSGAVEACWAHNPEVRRSKLRSANSFFVAFCHNECSKIANKSMPARGVFIKIFPSITFYITVRPDPGRCRSQSPSPAFQSESGRDVQYKFMILNLCNNLRNF